MKFDRKSLRKIFEDAEIEVPKDVLGQLCDLHTSSTDEITESLKEAQTNLDKVTQERDDLKKNAPTGETVSKEEFDKIKAEYDDYKKGIEAKDLKVAKEKALDLVLKEANISSKYYDAIKKVTKYDDMELGEDGKFTNHDELVKSHQTDYEAFVETEQVGGAETKNPPANNSKQDNLEDLDMDAYIKARKGNN